MKKHSDAETGKAEQAGSGRESEVLRQPGQAMWGGRFTKPPHELVEEWASSVRFDSRLAPYDIQGSLAHVRMLGEQGVLSADDVSAIVAGLAAVRAEVEEGTLLWRQELEDVHMNVEGRLTEIIGLAGGRLHTGRSRNDQVALDMHLYVRDELLKLRALLADFQSALIEAAEAHLDVIIPGYTHLQRAQPVLLAHHLLAYVWMLERDRERTTDALRRTDRMPLGAGALAGTTFPIDREKVARELGFSGLYENSMDAVSDRDYIAEALFVLATIMMHLSRLAEELILWTSTEFGFVELDDAFTTGSSIMPQKKNPDIAELVRGKTGRVYGHLMALLTTLKGLPLAYNKDLQEDKEGLFDGFDTVIPALRLFAAMIRSLRVNRNATSAALAGDYSAATDMADYLVEKGVPFRQAHEIVGRLVLYCTGIGKPFAALTAEELQAHSELLDVAVLERLTPEAVVAARASRGGTAPAAVAAQLQLARRLLQNQD